MSLNKEKLIKYAKEAQSLKRRYQISTSFGDWHVYEWYLLCSEYRKDGLLDEFAGHKAAVKIFQKGYGKGFRGDIKENAAIKNARTDEETILFLLTQIGNK